MVELKLLSGGGVSSAECLEVTVRAVSPASDQPSRGHWREDEDDASDRELIFLEMYLLFFVCGGSSPRWGSLPSGGEPLKASERWGAPLLSSFPVFLLCPYLMVSGVEICFLFTFYCEKLQSCLFFMSDKPFEGAVCGTERHLTGRTAGREHNKGL